MLYLLPQNFFKPLVIQKTFCALLSIGALAKNSFRSALVKKKQGDLLTQLPQSLTKIEWCSLPD